MSPQMILPVYDPECRRVFHPDRQGAQAHVVALEIWNRATGRDLRGRRLMIFRCPRCAGYHVGTTRNIDAAARSFQGLQARIEAGEPEAVASPA